MENFWLCFVPLFVAVDAIGLLPLFISLTEGIDKKNIIPLTSKIESRYNKKIEIHYFGKNFYSNKKDPIINDILRNGVKLI